MDDWDYLHDRIGVCKSIMRLQDWQIYLSREEPDVDEGVHAEANIAQNLNYVTLRFGRAFWASSSDDKIATILHELSHCITEPICSQVEAVCRHKFTDTEWAVVESVMKRPVELATEHICRLVSGPKWENEE